MEELRVEGINLSEVREIKNGRQRKVERRTAVLRR